MRRHLFSALLMGLIFSGATQADVIRDACMKSERKAANAPLCGCVQQAADATLTRRDQKLASRFFEDPDQSQEIRQSDRRSHEKFWERYKSFSTLAKTYCS